MQNYKVSTLSKQIYERIEYKGEDTSKSQFLECCSGFLILKNANWNNFELVYAISKTFQNLCVFIPITLLYY